MQEETLDPRLRTYNVDGQIADRQNVDLKIVNRQNVDLKIVDRQNVDFKIVTFWKSTIAT
jgi:hypothetical protein